MKNLRLFEAIGDIDDALIAECENAVSIKPKHARVKWMLVAACICLVIVGAFALPRARQIATFLQKGRLPVAPDSARASLPGEDGGYCNRLETAPTFTAAAISLHAEDYQPMAGDELLNYYNATFSISSAVPQLKQQPQNATQQNGVFKNSSRGVYYDSNSFVFAGSDGTPKLTVQLSKVSLTSGFCVGTDEGNAQWQQSEINGFGVTIFQYTGENGINCFYTEFVTKQTAYRVSAEQLPWGEYKAVLASLIADNVDTKTTPCGAQDEHVVKGAVTVVDETAGAIAITSENSDFTGYRIEGLGSEVKNYVTGDRVQLSYTGNPVLIDTLQSQQVKSIVKLANLK